MLSEAFIQNVFWTPIQTSIINFYRQSPQGRVLYNKPARRLNEFQKGDADFFFPFLFFLSPLKEMEKLHIKKKNERSAHTYI